MALDCLLISVFFSCCEHEIVLFDFWIHWKLCKFDWSQTEQFQVQNADKAQKSTNNLMLCYGLTKWNYSSLSICNFVREVCAKILLMILQERRWLKLIFFYSLVSIHVTVYVDPRFDPNFHQFCTSNCVVPGLFSLTVSLLQWNKISRKF